MKKFLTLAVLVCLALIFCAAGAALAEGGAGYTMEFTRDGLQYVLPGDSTVELNEILSAVGLTGAVRDVTFSDPGLLNIYLENNEW